MSTGLGREDIRALLDDLSAELAARGARAEIFLVGGAALAVAYDATRATRDLDAVFIPTTSSGRPQGGSGTPGTRRRLAKRRGERIPARPRPGRAALLLKRLADCRCRVPRYLLAMKLFAARAEIDADDIILLYRQLGFTTVDEGLDLVEQAYQAGRSRRR